jgi:hypothetical protein
VTGGVPPVKKAASPPILMANTAPLKMVALHLKWIKNKQEVRYV